MATERVPHFDVAVLQSHLRVFSTLASHLRQQPVRNHGQVAAIEQEIDLIRCKLGYRVLSDAEVLALRSALEREAA